MRVARLGVLFALTAMLSQPGWAADLGKTTQASDNRPSAPWTYEATLYGWGTGLSGDFGVGQFPSTSANLGLADILRHLNGVFMGALTARNDTYILGADLVWTKLSANKTYGLTNPPAFSGLNANLGVSEAIGTAFAGYRIPINSPNLALYGTLGVRVFDVSGSLSLTAAPLIFAFNRSASGTQTWADPVAGVMGWYRIDDRWFLSGEADVGAWSHSMTAQGFAAVGYNWKKNVSTSLGYRVLYADYNKGAASGFRYRATMNGPIVTLTLGF